MVDLRPCLNTFNQSKQYNTIQTCSPSRGSYIQISRNNFQGVLVQLQSCVLIFFHVFFSPNKCQDQGAYIGSLFEKLQMLGVPIITKL